MKLKYLMLFLVLVSSAAAGTVGKHEDEIKDIDSRSVPVEHSNIELSGDNSSKVQRRSLGLPFGTLPGYSPLRSLVACRHSNRRRHSHRNHHYHHHQHHRHNQNHNGYQYYPPQVPFVTTSFRPIPALTTVKPTQVTDPKRDTFTQATTIGTTVPTTKISTTKLITSTAPTTTTTTTTTTSTTTTAAPDTTTSTSTPRYNDPDNELIYDIDLRFRV